MTANAIRRHIIDLIFRLDREPLLRVLAEAQSFTAPGGSNLPEWLTTKEAASLLHITTRHARRLANTIPPGVPAPGRNASGLLIHRDTIHAILTRHTAPTTRHASTKNTQNPSATRTFTRTSPTRPKRNSDTVTTVSESLFRDAANFQTTPDIPPKSAQIFKLPASTPPRS